MADRLPQTPTRQRRAWDGGDLRLDYVPYIGAVKGVDLGAFGIITTGLGTFGNLDVDTLNFNGNIISDSTGTISFADENLATTGIVTAPRFNIGPTGFNYLVMVGIDIHIVSQSKLYLDPFANKIECGSSRIQTTGQGVFGSLTVDGTTLRANEVGYLNKVGIRTAIPATTLQVVGDSRFGDQATNYAEFETDGTLEFNGTATIWDDLRTPVNTVKVPGSKAPTWTSYSAGLLLGFSYQSVGGNEEEVYFTVQIPHGRKPGSDIFPHVHWVPNEDTTDDPEVVRWGMEYEWVDMDGSFSGTTTIYGEESFTDTADKHTVTDLTTIDGSGHTALISMLVCRLFRNSSHANDTYDSGSALALLLEIDFHIEMDMIGSRQAWVK